MYQSLTTTFELQKCDSATRPSLVHLSGLDAEHYQMLENLSKAQMHIASVPLHAKAKPANVTHNNTSYPLGLGIHTARLTHAQQ
jgi:hypothetical protein